MNEVFLAVAIIFLGVTATIMMAIMRRHRNELGRLHEQIDAIRMEYATTNRVSDQDLRLSKRIHALRRRVDGEALTARGIVREVDVDEHYVRMSLTLPEGEAGNAASMMGLRVVITSEGEGEAIE